MITPRILRPSQMQKAWRMECTSCPVRGLVANTHTLPKWSIEYTPKNCPWDQIRRNYRRDQDQETGCSTKVE